MQCGMQSEDGEGSDIHRTQSLGRKTPIPDFLGPDKFDLASEKGWLSSRQASSPHTAATISHPRSLLRKKANSLPRKAFKEFDLGTGRFWGTPPESTISPEASPPRTVPSF